MRARKQTRGIVRSLEVLGMPVDPQADQHLELLASLEDAPDDVRETIVYVELVYRELGVPIWGAFTNIGVLASRFIQR